MAIHGLTESLSERLQQMEREGRLKGRESVVVGFVPSKDGRGPRFLIEDEGDKLFLRMNSNSYLGMAVRLESVRRLQAGLHSFLSMRRIEARRKNASAFRLRHSQSLAKRRQRLSQAMVRSTIQRFGKTTNPLT